MLCRHVMLCVKTVLGELVEPLLGGNFLRHKVPNSQLKICCTSCFFPVVTPINLFDPCIHQHFCRSWYNLIDRWSWWCYHAWCKVPAAGFGWCWYPEINEKSAPKRNHPCYHSIQPKHSTSGPTHRPSAPRLYLLRRMSRAARVVCSPLRLLRQAIAYDLLKNGTWTIAYKWNGVHLFAWNGNS